MKTFFVDVQADKINHYSYFKGKSNHKQIMNVFIVPGSQVQFVLLTEDFKNSYRIE